jgi:selenocysteine-specific elongation factor
MTLRHFILGTAGHIDHGKTSLVKALTGTDTDRLPEEQRRGMTIELGFAELDLGDVRFGVVDVPGHEKFVRTMVAGATGIDVALVVVASDDSVMPQTVEHVEILDLLGVHRAVVALTKCDVVDRDMLALVAEEVRNLLSTTPMRDAEIIPVCSLTGEGIAELKAALHRVALLIEQRSNAGPFRMAIDRVFTIQGRGTVVTGSVLAGRVATGDSLELHPIGRTCRVRDVQSHGRVEDRLLAGQRAALNLIGVERDSVERGFELAAPGYLTPSKIIDARLTLLPSHSRRPTDVGSASKPLRDQQRVRIGMGATEHIAKLVILDDILSPLVGGTPASCALNLPNSHVLFVQLRFLTPVTAVHGQRFILRDETATRTMGGGVVLRPVARRARRTGKHASDVPPRAGISQERCGLEILSTHGGAERVEEVWRYAGFEPLTELQIAARAGVDPLRVAAMIAELQSAGRLTSLTDESISTSVMPGTARRVTLSTWQAVTDRVLAQLGKYHAAHPDQPGCPIDTITGWIDRKTTAGVGKLMFDRMVADGKLRALGRYVALPAFAPALSVQDEKCYAAMLAEFRAAAFKPPLLSDLKITNQATLQRMTRLAKLAIAAGDLAQISPEIFLHAETEQQLREIVARLIDTGREVTVAEVRQATDSSRKFVVPFLEYLDRVGFTQRIGDIRVRAGQPGAM